MSSPATTELRVSGMTCKNCARHVTEAIQGVSGVRSVSVNLQDAAASIRWDSARAKSTAARRTPTFNQPPFTIEPLPRSTDAKPAVTARRAFDSIQLFTQRDRLPWFWFFFTVLVLLLSAMDRYHIVSQFKQRERVVIIDPAGTCYLIPLLQFSEAKELHIQQAELATMAWHYVFALFRSPASTAAPSAPVYCGIGATRTGHENASPKARTMPD